MIGHSPALRWSLKKAARAGVALGSAAAHPFLDAGARAKAEVRVLTYHRFGDAARDPFCVSVDCFERQMAWLAAHARPVTLADVEAVRAGAAALPQPAVLVTIDDGVRSLYTHALPILRRHGVPAVAFVPVGPVERGGRSEGGESALTWSELREIAAAGIAVGSHAWDHRSLGAQSPEAIRAQVQRSRAALEQRLGVAVTAFAYPFGTRADYSAGAAEVLRESGYRCAFTSQHGAVRPGADAFALPRIKVEGGEDLWMFRRLCRGGLDAWHWIDRTLWRIQARPQ